MIEHTETLNDIACERIKQIRLLKNYRQEDLADKLNIDRTTYNKIELGRTDISLNFLQRLADVFEVEVSQLLNISPTKIVNINADKIILSSNGSNSVLNLTISPKDINELTS